MRLLEAVTDQAALAIERTTLVADIEAARLAGETERLRAALLYPACVLGGSLALMLGLKLLLWLALELLLAMLPLALPVAQLAVPVLL